MTINRIYVLWYRALSLLFKVNSTTILSAQKSDSTVARIYNFGGAVTIQSNRISTIPSLTLGKPAAVVDLKVGRKLAFEPKFSFSLEGKPWAMVFWWRYYGSIGNKFKLTLHANYSLAYKSFTYYTSSGAPQNIIRTTRYLVVAVAPNCQVNKYIGVGTYIFYNYGIETYITRNTWLISFRPSFSNLPITNTTAVRFNPEINYLKMNDKDGVYLNATLLISRKNFPLSVSAFINKLIESEIPSEYDLL